MSFDEARDIINAVFKNYWDTTTFPAVYTDVPSDPPSNDTPWARLVLRHSRGGQSSLAGEIGTRRFNRVGTVFVQIFTPVGDGLTQGYNLAQGVVNAYEDARESVWFRNVQMKEIGSNGAYEQINVTATFEYDEVR